MADPGGAVPRAQAGAPPPQRRALLILFVTVFLDLVGFGIVIPLLPLYAEAFGAGPVAVTWLVAVYSLMQFFFAPWWGQLSDRVGRRPVLLVGLFGSAASYLLFGLAGSLAVLFAARVLAGFMGANISVAQAYVADVLPAEDRARGMGLIGAAFGLGFIFGPALGGLLAPYGAAVPFLAAALLAATNGVLALAWLPESRPAQARRARRSARATPAADADADVGGAAAAGLATRLRGLAHGLREPRLGRLLLVSFGVTFAFAAMEATFALWGNRRWALSAAQIAYWFAYLGVLFTLVQGVLVGPLARRLGERRLALLGGGVFALGLAGIAVAPSQLWLALALAALAFGQGTTTPTLSALISYEAAAEDRGRLLGISQSLSAMARVAGPLWGGLVFATAGVGAPFATGAALVVAVLFALRSLPPRRVIA